MIFLLGTWVVAPIALIFLVKKRKFRLFFYFALAIILGPVLYHLIMSIEDRHLRMWVAMPISLFLPIYLMLGFWICVKALDAMDEPKPHKMSLPTAEQRVPFRMTRRRYVGVLLFVVGIV